MHVIDLKFSSLRLRLTRIIANPPRDRLNKSLDFRLDVTTSASIQFAHQKQVNNSYSLSGKFINIYRRSKYFYPNTLCVRIYLSITSQLTISRPRCLTRTALVQAIFKTTLPSSCCWVFWVFLLTKNLMLNQIFVLFTGVIGAERSSDSEAMSAIFSRLPEPLRPPMVSYSSTSVSLSNKQAFPNFFRTIYSDGIQVKVCLM